MHKELYSIKLIRDYLENKNIISNSISNIDELYIFFQYLSRPDSRERFNSLYILNYINQYIVDDDVAKRKTSARVFEDLLAIIFNGEVADNKKRKNIENKVPIYFNLTKDKIAGNKREKIDLLFNKGYGVSLKTLMMNNSEINMGSFEKKILFDGFNISNYLTERKTDSEIGLGSIPRLRNLLQKISQDGFYGDFQERFTHMFKFIFSDDIILAIKDTSRLYLYFFKGSEFTDLVIKRISNIDGLLSIINRWEGNSIRINRTKLIESCKRTVMLDLSILDHTVIKIINEFDYKLHKTYVEYFNASDNHRLKNIILKGIETLFNEFDSKFETLK